MSLVMFPEQAPRREAGAEDFSCSEPPDCAASSEQDVAANQRIALLGQMTAGIAHDFRNILGVIESGLRLVEASADDAEKRGFSLAAAREGVERGLRVTSRLLAFANRRELAAAPYNVNDLLSDFEAFLKYAAGPGIRLALRLAPDLPASLIDPPQFNAAILNLLVNSRDAMPEGGEIVISTARVVRAPPPSGGADHDIFVRVRVEDTGQGMPLSVCRRIFDPFFTTKGESGTGLGVPQVHAFVKEAGGFVSIDSQIGRGTVFDLFLPVNDGSQLLRATA